MRPEDIDKLTDDEIRELLHQPMSADDMKRYRQMDEDSKWLLALNLHEMDREEEDNSDT